MGRKLKRFLLRYDPPGIGLEVQQSGGECEIVHKDLLPPEQVSSVADILAEVDRIISEDEMLTKKRHRPALIQLLGRLYQLDVSNLDAQEDEEQGSPGHSPKEGKGSEEASMLQEGSAVVLTGLKGDMAPHNGELGTLTKCRHDKKKYEVHMTNSGADVKVKGPEHIALCAPRGTPLSVGAGVVIRGLRNHTELNGCLGRVVECHEEARRFEVRAVESGQLFRVKQENLVPIDMASVPASTKAGTGGGAHHESAVSLHQGGSGGEEEDSTFPVGSLVELVGLKTAMAFNGQTAEVLSVDRSRHRYEIQLSDGSVKTIRAENVVLAKGAKVSPRTGKRKTDRAK